MEYIWEVHQVAGSNQAGFRMLFALPGGAFLPSVMMKPQVVLW